MRRLVCRSTFLGGLGLDLLREDEGFLSGATPNAGFKTQRRTEALPMIFVYLILVILGSSLFVLLALRLWDGHAERMEWKRLVNLQPVNPLVYTPFMVSDLPQPAKRFFNFAINLGAPLMTAAEINMGGQFSLGSREKPIYQKMHAEQILAAPSGFIWKLRLPGVVPVSGSDSGLWTRFRIFGLMPVARLGGDLDHTRAAFGRYVAEALFWTPAALLPCPGVVWEQVDENTARVTVSYMGLTQSVDLKVDVDGRPIEVFFMRWSNANSEKKYRLQPFGGKMSDYREVQGFRLPFNLVAGNMYGTDDYFPFFKAEVTSIHFP